MKYNVSIELREKARKLGLCDKWFNEWEDNTEEQHLIDKYFKGSDFCLKHHYPSNEYIKENFEQSLLRKNAILVDDKYSLLNPKYAMILGTSASIIRVNTHHVCNIYVRDNSKINVIAKNSSFVLIHAMDNAVVTADAQDSAKVVVFRNSKKAKIEAFGNAKEKEDFNFLK